MMRILVLENEADVRLMLAHAFRLEGAEVVAVEGCAAAMRAVEEHRFDAAVVDLGLAGVDGLTCAEKLKKHDRLCRLYAYTAYEEATHPSASMALFEKCFRKGTPDDQTIIREVMSGYEELRKMGGGLEGDHPRADGGGAGDARGGRAVGEEV